MTRRVDQVEFPVRARGVLARRLPEGRCAGVCGHRELDGVRRLRRVRFGGRVAALEEGQERGLAAACRAREEDEGEARVRRLARDEEVDEDWYDEDY